MKADNKECNSSSHRFHYTNMQRWPNSLTQTYQWLLVGTSTCRGRVTFNRCWETKQGKTILLLTLLLVLKGPLQKRRCHQLIGPVGNPHLPGRNRECPFSSWFVLCSHVFTCCTPGTICDQRWARGSQRRELDRQCKTKVANAAPVGAPTPHIQRQKRHPLPLKSDWKAFYCSLT